MTMRLAWIAAVLLPLAVEAAREEGGWTEVGADAMDVALLDERAKRLLQGDGYSWRHAQTDHFVLHFDSGIFASKVARLAEFYYGYISADLAGAKDRMEGRSHIFIFRKEREWKEFMARDGGGVSEWAFSFVSGPAMYLQQAGDTSSSMDVLGHEMTHLVMNRFFTHRLPLWLNEGIAEWYEEFAWSAYKGVKKSRRAQFKRMTRPLPLDPLMRSVAYPQPAEAVHLFYETSKALVGFLQLGAGKPDAFVPYLNDIASGMNPNAALEKHYGYASVAALEKDFAKFIK